MPEILQSKNRKARKTHICSYCNGVIEKDEEYRWAKAVHDGELYEWKNHIDCGFVASELWQFIDPDEGMTEEDFTEGCREFCNTFCCPECQKCNKDEFDDLECNDNLTYCLDKIVDKLKTHDLKKVKTNRDWMSKWTCVPKEVSQ
jgi:hypothetical protein